MYWSMYVRQCDMYVWLVSFIVHIWCMCSLLSDTKIMQSPLEFRCKLVLLYSYST